MRPWLTERGIDVVAMTSGPEKAVVAQQQRDGIGFGILLDPDLATTRQLGWYDKAGLKHATRKVLGVPIGVPVGYQRMPRPATVLLDEDGIVRWLDVTDDYRLRGDEDTIRLAVEDSFGC